MGWSGYLFRKIMWFEAKFYKKVILCKGGVVSH